MGQRKKQIDQCLNDIKKYEKWGNLLAGQSWGASIQLKCSCECICHS